MLYQHKDWQSHTQDVYIRDLNDTEEFLDETIYKPIQHNV